MSDEIKKPKIVFAEEDEQSQSLWAIMWTQFLEHKMAVASLGVIVIFALIGIFAGPITSALGVDGESQNVFSRYQVPGTQLVLDDSEQESKLEEFLDNDSERASRIISLMEKSGRSIASLEVSEGQGEDALFETFAELQDPEVRAGFASLGGSDVQAVLALKDSFNKTHHLGTDELGRDVLARLIYGARISMGVGIMVAFFSAIIGLIIGAIAGVWGGWVDSLLMRITDSMLSLPTIPFLIVFAAVDLNKLPLLKSFISGEHESIYKLIFILCIFSWMTVARLVRGSILSIKEREYILAAKTMGASRMKIIATHMVPNILAPLLVAVTLNVGNSILFEAALSFLGLGIQPPTPSWGNMLLNAQEIIFEAPFLAVFPGLLIFLVVVAFNFVGDGLQLAVDPKSVKR